MTYVTSTAHSLPRRPFWPNLGRMMAAWRSRRQLAALDDRALADIGVSRAEARAEASRPIWDVPHTWRD